MPIVFKQATKQDSKLRLALYGPSGSGKTFTALAIVRHLVGEGGKIALMDTEHGSASKYADLHGGFDVFEADGDYSPQVYTEAIRAAERAGYDALIIDSLSHAWTGTGGALDLVDRTARASGNKFTAWGGVTPLINTMVDTIIGAKLHVIATMRSKTEYLMEQDGKGKTSIRKVGTAPIQREGVEYEFDIVGTMDLDNTLSIEKTRCPSLRGKTFNRPGIEVAEIISAWLTGTSAEDNAATAEALRVEFMAIYDDQAAAKETEICLFVSRGEAGSFDALSGDQLLRVQRQLEKRLATAAAAAV